MYSHPAASFLRLIRTTHQEPLDTHQQQAIGLNCINHQQIDNILASQSCVSGLIEWFGHTSRNQAPRPLANKKTNHLALPLPFSTSSIVREFFFFESVMIDLQSANTALHLQQSSIRRKD